MLRLTILISLLFVSGLAFANPTCSGKVSGISLSNSGGVYATIKDGNSVNLADVVFCGITATAGVFAGETCKALYSMLLTAEAMDKTVTLWFQAANFESCSQSWKGLAPFGFYHIRMN